ncbi:MAG: hypothetical protein KDD45_09025, partial [Bdellovibrionales bacterium]|nr:hypothetical protein [Bdellovibrionales bacterium]
KDRIYTAHYKVTTYDADPFGYAKPSSLMNYMQDASGMHAVQWGLSVFDLFTEGKTWVISRYHLKIFNRPSIGKEIVIKTWPSTIQKLFILREFEAYSEPSKLIAKASISVAMIDLKTKKPIPLGNNMPLHYLTPQRTITEDFTHLEKIIQPTRTIELPVMLRDLDANGHVNHVVYAQWALEAVPTETWNTHHLSGIEINYKAEVRHGFQIISKVEKITSETDTNTIIFHHQIFHKETMLELTRLRTSWSRK